MDLMHLLVVLPVEVALDTTARSITARALDGAFCLRPRHVDVVTALPPGVLRYLDVEGDEQLVGVDDAVLVKVGAEVVVTTARAVRGAELGGLEAQVRADTAARDAREEQTRAALRRLEATFLRGFLELDRRSGSATDRR